MDHHTTTSGRLIVVGDLNIHLNNQNDQKAKQFLDLLSSLSLHQHVSKPTHNHGKTSDAVITRSGDSHLIESLTITPFAFSDHHQISFTLPWTKPNSVRNKITFRKLNSLDINKLESNLQNSSLISNPPPQLNNLIQEYNSTLSDILEDLAPLQTKDVVLRPHAPWYNQQIRKAKQSRRQAERRCSGARRASR